MRKPRPWLFVALPVLYLAVVLGFVVLQFSKKTDSFSQSLGDLTLTGKVSNGNQPAELALRGRGLDFLFDANHALTVDTRDGATTRLRPLSWTWKDGNAVVSFEQGVQLIFEKSEGGGQTLAIHPVANDAARRLAAVRIPFAPQGGGRLNRSPRGTVAELVRDKTRQLISVDGAQDRIEPENVLVLAAGKNGFRPARLDPLPAGLPADLAWLSLDRPVTAEGAEAALTQYWNRAYAAWPSAPAFSTRLADAWSREALLRGEYPAALARLQALLGRDPQAWSFDASPYLGNIVELTAAQRRNVEAASSRSQPDFTGQGSLWWDAQRYGPEGSADRVRDLLIKGKVPDEVPGLLGALQNLLALQAAAPSEAAAARLDEVQSRLVGLVVRREGALFVRTGPNLLDLQSSLVLGRLWLSAARQGKEGYGDAGALLVTSVLAFQDASGRLPQTLVLQDGAVVRQEGTLAPEDVYEAVRPAAATETDLPAWGPGVFVRTPATIVSATVTPTEARLVLKFPTGSAEHLLISGVKAFDHITLHGIRWRTDPQFQSYTDGWAYSASTRTLYFKIKHRDDVEELVVHYAPEP